MGTVINPPEIFQDYYKRFEQQDHHHILKVALFQVCRQFVKDPGCIASFTILTPDIQHRGMPDPSTLEGQQALEPFLKDIEFIVVDNISTLCRSGKENEAEGWILVQAWALRMRSKGISVLFVHHAAKNGNARGNWHN